jgi:hypothetical protein
MDATWTGVPADLRPSGCCRRLFALRDFKRLSLSKSLSKKVTLRKTAAILPLQGRRPTSME